MSNRRFIISVAVLALLVTLPAWADDEARNKAGVFKFDERTFEVREGAGVAIITVERSRGEDGAVSVSYSTGEATALAGSDFEAVSGVLEWGDGDESSRTFMVPIVDDDEHEGREVVDLILGEPTGGAELDHARSRATLVIFDNDGAGHDEEDDEEDDGEDDEEDDGEDDGEDDEEDRVRNVLKIDPKNVFVLEGRDALVGVERSKGEDGAISVEYETHDGSATAGEDYEAVSGILEWADGDDEVKTFLVPTFSDDVLEGRETIRVTLSNPTGGAQINPGHSRGLIRIVDGEDDGMPGDRAGLVKFAHREFQEIEGDTHAVIGVERSRGKSGVVSVEYMSADGSATAGDDYEAVSGVLTWGHGDGGVKTFTVPVFDDDLEEGNETVELTLKNPTGGAELHPERHAAPLNILDDDGATDACAAGAHTLCLLGNRFAVEVAWRTEDGSGQGTAVPVADESGLFWFFSDSNIEMLVKMVDACDLPGFETFWVFFAATTNVDFQLTVTDTVTGVVKEYSNPLGQAAEPVQDTLTFKTCS